MTLENTITLESLPDGFYARPVTLDDMPAFMPFAHACDIDHYGKVVTIEADIRTQWTYEDFKLEESTRAIFTGDGQMVAYAEVWDTHKVPVQPWTWARTHPEWRNKGLGTALFHWVEGRTREVFDRVPADAKVTLRAGTLSSDESANAHLVNMGMTTNRVSLEMRIDMETPPPAAQWPEGITVITFEQLNDLPAVHQAVEDAFQDHRGFVKQDPEEGLREWKHFIDNDPHYMPGQWYLAMDGERIAGLSLCRPVGWDTPDAAYVMELGVRREYRNRGLGLALLHHTFGEYWKMGQKLVTLHVDGSSLTGATRLYERAGMHTSKSFNQYEKVLRDGKEYSNQG